MTSVACQAQCCNAYGHIVVMLVNSVCPKCRGGVAEGSAAGEGPGNELGGAGQGALLRACAS